jgi:hypothetical protein
LGFVVKRLLALVVLLVALVLLTGPCKTSPMRSTPDYTLAVFISHGYADNFLRCIATDTAADIRMGSGRPLKMPTTAF